MHSGDPIGGGSMTAIPASVSDAELEQWAKMRADDAGRLARELIEYRRAAFPAVQGEATPVGYVTKSELAQLRLGASCVDLFGAVVPSGVEIVPLFTAPYTLLIKAGQGSAISTSDTGRGE